MTGTGWSSVLTSNTVTPEQRAAVVQQAVEGVQNAGLALMRDRQALRARAAREVDSAARATGVVLPPDVRLAVIQEVVAQCAGLGFLDQFLPPTRTDISEISINPDGSVWIRRKGELYDERADVHPTVEEVWRAVEALLAPTGKGVSEATPSVNARLPRFAGFGGARVNITHPVITPGKGYPAVSIRLFEPRPVPPEQLLEWGMFEKDVLDMLLEAVAGKLRVLVIGGTATGKTTALSALAHGIPRQARIVKCEDPEEIWLPHENVVTLEPRPRIPGSEIDAYTLGDAVNDALRKAPNWIIVGEVRLGDAASALLSAQMTDHPGLSTLHAHNPSEAVLRMSLILRSEKNLDLRFDAAKLLFFQAVDLVVAVGWSTVEQDGERKAVRKCLGVWETKDFAGGDVKFRELWMPGMEEVQPPRRRRE
ncbi:MAG TPA: CpaF family protein [Planctomycetes bacterium]|nr:CpaF family protein [Planctomycetota bacterium]